MTMRMLLWPAATPPELRPYDSVWLYLGCGLYFLFAGVVMSTSAKGIGILARASRAAGRNVCLALALASVNVFCGYTLLGMWVQHQIRSNSAETPSEALIGQQHGRIATPGPVNNFWPTLDQWAEDHGYEIAALVDGNLRDTHRAPMVPTGVTLRAAVLWNPHITSRLTASRSGLWSPTPEIVVQSASSNKGSITSISFASSWMIRAERYAGGALQTDLQQTLQKGFTAALSAPMTMSATRPAVR